MTPAEREQLRLRYLAMDTSNVADVLDALGLLNQGLAPGFRPFPAEPGRIAGWAYTNRGQMTPYPQGGDEDKMRACQGLSAGEISVWAGDDEGTCCFGELIALGMKERGCVGALVDGGVRDVRWMAQHSFPVFARYRSPVQSIGRWKVNACQVPVFLKGATGTVTVRPGDFILGDDDGAIVVPYEVAEQVLVEAERLTRTEGQIRTEIANGLTLAGALEKYGHV
jgi:regulator of RNase E activity RraA